MTGDPYTVLGVAPDADADELAAARRRRAFEVHPDRGGTVAQMQELNEAYAAAQRMLADRSRPAAPDPPVVPPEPPAPAAPPRRERRSSRLHQRVVRDDASFTIDALPAEAFEALLVVTSWMGELLADDPPYVLEAFLHDPEPCWCRLDLVPDAGGSTVSFTVAGVDGPAPDVEDVRV